MTAATKPLAKHIKASPGNLGFRMLSQNPPVIYLQDWHFRTFSNQGRHLLEALRFRRPHVIVSLSWSYENPTLVRRLARRIRLRGFGFRSVTILTNTEKEVPLFKQAGLTAIWCSHNAFLSERIFHPTGETREFDAVYDAALSKYKRHELASDIKSLALISYVKSSDSLEQARSRAACVPQAKLLNNPFIGETGMLSAVEVNSALNRARVGLCLSDVEGAMFASAQYLLAGIPVVTTRNLGGRDGFFDPCHTRWVADDPPAVAEAVQELASAKLDPIVIRNSVLEKMAGHRARFCGLVAQLAGDAGRPWSDDWPTDAPNKLYLSRPLNWREFLVAASGQHGWIG